MRKMLSLSPALVVLVPPSALLHVTPSLATETTPCEVLSHLRAVSAFAFAFTFFLEFLVAVASSSISKYR